MRSSGGNDGIRLKDASAGEVDPQALEDDDVGGKEEEASGVVVEPFGDGVEVLPGDGKGHHLGLAASCCHLDGVAGEVVVLEDVDAGHCGVPFDQIAMAADVLHLEEIDHGFDRVPLGVVVREGTAIGHPVIRREPVVEEQLGGLGRTLVLAVTPLGNGLADGGHARRRRDPRFEEARLIGVRS